MTRLMPDLIVRPLTQADAQALATLLNPLLDKARYSRRLDSAAVVAQILRQQPPTIFAARLLDNRCLGAWRAGELVGVADTAVGLDSESLDRPDYLPLGLLRFLIPPTRDDLHEEVMAALMEAADAFWRSAGVAHVKAFHLSTGYPAFQGGVGVLPGDWATHVRLLTSHGFQFAERYYCVHRPLQEPVEEFVSLAEISLVYRGALADRRYEIYRRAERLASARLVQVDLADEGEAYAVGLIASIFVDSHWRRRDFGRWLVARMINDGLAQRYRELVAYVSMGQGAAMNLFTQLGFEEHHYRGYALERSLTA